VQLFLPVGGSPLQQASGLDAVDGGVGAQGQALPQQLVGGDADLGQSGLTATTGSGPRGQRLR
jgi:hypothetical protein